MPEQPDARSDAVIEEEMERMAVVTDAESEPALIDEVDEDDDEGEESQALAEGVQEITGHATLPTRQTGTNEDRGGPEEAASQPPEASEGTADTKEKKSRRRKAPTGSRPALARDLGKSYFPFSRVQKILKADEVGRSDPHVFPWPTDCSRPSNYRSFSKFSAKRQLPYPSLQSYLFRVAQRRRGSKQLKKRGVRCSGGTSVCCAVLLDC